MARIRSRVALALAAAALSSVFVTASPAAAAGGCYPYPEVYCDAQEFYYDCVYTPIRYGYMPEHCPDT